MKTELMEQARNILTVEDAKKVMIGFIEKVEKIEKAGIQNGKDIKSLTKEVTEESTLSPAEAKRFQDAVKVKGVEVLGGKKSEAYSDRGLRRRVFMDIHTEVKRNYGLVLESGRQLGYVFLKRKYLDNALNCISEYIPPVVLANEIDALNEA